jgi:uncharacterized protein YlzI (FlbEa/FlbD family)
MKEEVKAISLLPRGLITLALGGYTKAESEPKVKEDVDAVVEKLTEFMQRTSSAMVVVDGQLRFIRVLIEKKKL